MIRWLGPMAAAAAIAVATLSLAALSHVRMSGTAGTDAIVRLAWSARPQRIESCRAVSEAELAALPAHMRQREICEGTSARYRVEVRGDDAVLLDMLARGGGLRRDRQLYVFREMRVASGTLDLAVRVRRADSAGHVESEQESSERHDERDDDVDRRHRDDREDRGDGRRRRIEDEMPDMLLLHERIALAPREVVLVTYDRERRALRIVRGASPPR